MTTYQISSIKHSEAFRGELAEAIERADAIEAEYQPAFGVQVEDEAGECVYDTADEGDRRN